MVMRVVAEVQITEEGFKTHHVGWSGCAGADVGLWLL